MIDQTPTNFVMFCHVQIIVMSNLLVAIQSKQLRKLIQQTFQQYATLKEDGCMVKFFETLKEFVSYDEEVFPCELVVSDNIMFNLPSTKSCDSHSCGFPGLLTLIYSCTF